MTTTPVAAGAPEATTPASAILARTDLDKVATALTEFDAVQLGLADLRNKYEGIVFEKIDTVAGMKIAIAARAAVREPRINLEKIRKEAKAPLLAIGKGLDARAKDITEQLAALEEPMSAQIQAEEERKEAIKRQKEEAERKRVEAVHAGINEYRAFVADAASGCFNSAQITDLAIWMAQIVPPEAVFAEFLVNAKLAVSESATALRKLAADAKVREDEAAENAQMRADLAELKAAEETRKAADAQRLAAEEAERNRRIAEEEAARRQQQEAEDAARREMLAREEAARVAARAEEDRRLAAEREELARQQRELDERLAAEARDREAREAAERTAREAEERRLAAIEQQRVADEQRAQREREAEERRREEVRAQADKRMRDAAQNLLIALKMAEAFICGATNDNPLKTVRLAIAEAEDEEAEALAA